jgi:crotonobetainyl-CoA:carnitine CoA-transferase CaiB-like acyl-CoA transferase
VLDTGEVLEDLHLWQRGMVQEVEHPTRGCYAMLGAGALVKVPPLHGEHTVKVLQQPAACCPQDLECWQNAGAV